MASVKPFQIPLLGSILETPVGYTLVVEGINFISQCNPYIASTFLVLLWPQIILTIQHFCFTGLMCFVSCHVLTLLGIARWLVARRFAQCRQGAQRYAVKCLFGKRCTDICIGENDYCMGFYWRMIFCLVLLEKMSGYYWISFFWFFICILGLLCYWFGWCWCMKSPYVEILAGWENSPDHECQESQRWLAGQHCFRKR